MDNIILLVGCLAAGMALHRFKLAPDNAHAALNMVVVYLALPALILLQVHAVRPERALVYAILMPWIVFAASASLFWCVGRMARLPRSTTGALTVIGGLGNTSFIGLPMIDSFYGPLGLPVGIMIDQLGTYLVLSTAGIVLISFYAEGAVSRRLIIRRILTFPPLIAMAVAAGLLPFDYPGWVITVLGRLGAVLAPVALVSIGLQLRPGALSGYRGPLAMGLGFKLLLAPLLILAAYMGMLHLRGMTTEVTVFEAAMAPQVGASIVAIQYGLNARLISLLVGVGTLFSFVTLPAWWLAMSFL